MRKKQRRSEPGNSLADSGAPPFNKPSHLVFARLKPAVELARGYPINHAMLGRMLGVQDSTAWRWCSSFDDEHVRAVFALLERLPVRQRHSVVDSLCRSLPSFGHEKLAHDPLALSELGGILMKEAGLTLLRGEPEHMREFVLSALGHEFPRWDSVHREVTGIDIHPPDRLVPVLGVHYRQEKLALASRIRSFVMAAWSRVTSSSAPLVLLNGIWTTAPDLRQPILELARTRHVITADAFPPKLQLGFRFDYAVHVISVSPAKEQPKWIRTRIEVLE